MALGTSYIIAYMDSTTPPTSQITQYGITVELGADEQYFKGAVTFLVPPNSYYKVTATTTGGGVTCTLTKWVETELF